MGLALSAFTKGSKAQFVAVASGRIFVIRLIGTFSSIVTGKKNDRQEARRKQNRYIFHTTKVIKLNPCKYGFYFENERRGATLLLRNRYSYRIV